MRALERGGKARMTALLALTVVQNVSSQVPHVSLLVQGELGTPCCVITAVGKVTGRTIVRC